MLDTGKDRLQAKGGLDYSYDAAVELAERGFTVLPMKGKQPVVAWRELQNRKNTEVELKQWFGPDAPERYNLGVICREFVVVDFDSQAAFQWFEERNPDAVTPMVTITGSGGRHLYFKRPGDANPIGNRQRLGGYDIDIRADGKGIAVVPPSIHRSGQPYRWLTPVEDLSMDDIPVFNQQEWLPQEEGRRPVVQTCVPDDLEVETTLRRIRAYVRKIESIQGQAGSNGCFRVACKLVEAGLSREQAMQEILAWNDDGPVQPKWSEAELAHKIDDAIRRHSR